MTASDYEVIQMYARTALELTTEAVTSCEMLTAYGRLCWHCERVTTDRPGLKEVAEAILGEAGYSLLQAARDRGYECQLAGAPDRYADVLHLLDADPRIQRINPLCDWLTKAASPTPETPEEEEAT